MSGNGHPPVLPAYTATGNGPEPAWPERNADDPCVLAVDTGGIDVSTPAGWEPVIDDELPPDMRVFTRRRPEDPCSRCGVLVGEHGPFGECPKR